MPAGTPAHRDLLFSAAGHTADATLKSRVPRCASTRLVLAL
ncbi:hypothetical protein ACFU7T_15425 [Streptomyces sp. NPDC057555]